MTLACPDPPPTRLWWLPGALLVGSLVAGAAMSVPATLASGTPDASVRDGKWAAAFSAGFDEHWPGHDLAVGVWGALEYGLLGAGREGVVVGEAGWLFTSEELEVSGEREARIAEAVALATQAQTRLAPSGGTLVVAVVPDKSRVCGAHLGRTRRPAVLGDRLDALRTALTQAGVNAPDLGPALACDGADGPGFLRTDTHWRPAGAEAAAQALAAAVPGTRGTTRFDVHPGETVPHTGDLVAFLALGPLAPVMAPRPDALPQRRVTRAAEGGLSAASLFGDEDLPMTLVGTSYSADPRWGFADSLKLAFGLDVVNLADKGTGPTAPMRAWLASEADAPTLLVWEFPERYLDAAPATPEADDADATP